MLSDLAHDLRIAARAFLSRPLFAGVAALTIAIAIGANTAVFSVVRGIVLRPLPYHEPDRLVSVWPNEFLSYRELLFLREHATSFSAVAGFVPGWSMALTGSGEAGKLEGSRVTANLFEVLGVPVVQGRFFVPEEEGPGSDRAVVLSGGLWQGRFGSDPRVVGQRLTLDGEPHTVVGVMPPSFEIYRPATEVWRVLAHDPDEWYYAGSGLFAVARLKAGVSVAEARAELRSLIGPMREAFGMPDDYGADADVRSLHTWLVGPLRPTLWLALGAVGFVLLLAGANLANLLLARAAGRDREIAVRTALGASRVRLVRQLLAESALLAAVGGAVGLGVAYWGARAAARLLPADTPLAGGIALDSTVLVVSVALTLATGLLFGLAPALTAARADLQSALRAMGGSRIGRTGARARNSLVAIEVALGTVLLVGAGLMIRTIWQLHRIDPGFRPAHVLTLELQPTGPQFETGTQRVAYYERVFEELEALPDVGTVGAIQHLPLTGFGWGTDVEIEGRPLAPGATPPRVGWRVIGGEYFRALQIPLRSGRWFEPTDEEGSPPVVVVNQTMARQLWPDEDAIGKRIRAGNATGGAWTTVIGIVGDVRHTGLDREPIAEIFRPITQYPHGGMTLVVRTEREPPLVARAVLDAIWRIDRNVPVASVRSLEEVAAASLAPRRTMLTLLGAFAAIGLVLGAVGTYGVVATNVAARTRELGIRLALGARPASLVWACLGRGLGLAAVGVALGLAAALLLGRALNTFVFNVSTTDPATLAAVGATLLGVAALASYVPSRRAARIDPVTTLREE